MDNTIYCPRPLPTCIRVNAVEHCIDRIFGRNTSFNIHAVLKSNMRDGYAKVESVEMWRKLHMFVTALDKSGRNMQNKYLTRREFNHIFKTNSEQQITLHEFCNWRDQFALSMLIEDELLEEDAGKKRSCEPLMSKQDNEDELLEEAAGKKRSCEQLMSKQDKIEVEDTVAKKPSIKTVRHR